MIRLAVIGIWVVGMGLMSTPMFAGTAWQGRVGPWVQMVRANAAKTGFSPTQAIQDLDRTLDDYRTNEPLSEADREHNRTLKRRVLYGIFDIRELCRISLGKYWTQRNAAEQDDLVTLMISLMEERAILSKEQGQRKSKSSRVYQVRYVGEVFEDTNKTRALVKTRVTVPSENLTVELHYKVRRKVGIWKIFDVIIDDSSLLENYTYQFTNIIEKHGYPELVRRMEKKLTELRANGGTATEKE